MKSWIVYLTKGNKIKAVEYEFNVEADIRTAGLKILGYPAAKTADDAVRYVEGMI
jgi:hypothetical protein